MSRYSGKCDAYDWFGDFTDEQFAKSEIYIGDHIVPLKINNQHDMAPYYPYLIAEGGSSNGVHKVHLSSRSFVDAEEEEHLTWVLNDFLRYYRKCKRNKKEYVEEEAIEKVCWFEPTKVQKEIAHRVALYGNKADIKGIRTYIAEHYRNDLLHTMIELGWDKRRAKYWIWKDWKMLLEEDNDKDRKT